ncbi:hypothetical protein CyaNS01_01206 [Cyanobium sp. NS01]|nr:hypothetical protein CyaNS01_01206 [Cyanobium sp. NS01]
MSAATCSADEASVVIIIISKGGLEISPSSDRSSLCSFLLAKQKL